MENKTKERVGPLTRKQCELMKNYLQKDVKPVPEELKDAGFPFFESSLPDKAKAALRFTSWASKLDITPDGTLVFGETGKELIPAEDIDCVVMGVHCNGPEELGGPHQKLRTVIQKMRQTYSLGRRAFGPSEAQIRSIVNLCQDTKCKFSLVMYSKQRSNAETPSPADVPESNFSIAHLSASSIQDQMDTVGMNAVSPPDNQVLVPEKTDHRKDECLSRLGEDGGKHAQNDCSGELWGWIGSQIEKSTQIRPWSSAKLPNRPCDQQLNVNNSSQKETTSRPGNCSARFSIDAQLSSFAPPVYHTEPDQTTESNLEEAETMLTGSVSQPTENISTPDEESRGPVTEEAKSQTRGIGQEMKGQFLDSRDLRQTEVPNSEICQSLIAGLASEVSRKSKGNCSENKNVVGAEEETNDASDKKGGNDEAHKYSAELYNWIGSQIEQSLHLNQHECKVNLPTTTSLDDGISPKVPSLDYSCPGQKVQNPGMSTPLSETKEYTDLVTDFMLRLTSNQIDDAKQDRSLYQRTSNSCGINEKQEKGGSVSAKIMIQGIPPSGHPNTFPQTKANGAYGATKTARSRGSDGLRLTNALSAKGNSTSSREDRSRPVSHTHLKSNAIQHEVQSGQDHTDASQNKFTHVGMPGDPTLSSQIFNLSQRGNSQPMCSQVSGTNRIILPKELPHIFPTAKYEVTQLHEIDSGINDRQCSILGSNKSHEFSRKATKTKRRLYGEPQLSGGEGPSPSKKSRCIDPDSTRRPRWMEDASSTSGLRAVGAFGKSNDQFIKSRWRETKDYKKEKPRWIESNGQSWSRWSEQHGSEQPKSEINFKDQFMKFGWAELKNNEQPKSRTAEPKSRCAILKNHKQPTWTGPKVDEQPKSKLNESNFRWEEPEDNERPGRRNGTIPYTELWETVRHEKTKVKKKRTKNRPIRPKYTEDIHSGENTLPCLGIRPNPLTTEPTRPEVLPDRYPVKDVVWFKSDSLGQVRTATERSYNIRAFQDSDYPTRRKDAIDGKRSKTEEVVDKDRAFISSLLERIRPDKNLRSGASGSKGMRDQINHIELETETGTDNETYQPVAPHELKPQNRQRRKSTVRSREVQPRSEINQCHITSTDKKSSECPKEHVPSPPPAHTRKILPSPPPAHTGSPPPGSVSPFERKPPGNWKNDNDGPMDLSVKSPLGNKSRTGVMRSLFGEQALDLSVKNEVKRERRESSSFGSRSAQVPVASIKPMSSEISSSGEGTSGSHERSSGATTPHLVRNRSDEAHVYSMMDTSASSMTTSTDEDPAEVTSVHVSVFMERPKKLARTDVASSTTSGSPYFQRSTSRVNDQDQYGQLDARGEILDETVPPDTISDTKSSPPAMSCRELHGKTECKKWLLRLPNRIVDENSCELTPEIEVIKELNPTASIKKRRMKPQSSKYAKRVSWQSQLESSQGSSTDECRNLLLGTSKSTRRSLPGILQKPKRRRRHDESNETKMGELNSQSAGQERRMIYQKSKTGEEKARVPWSQGSSSPVNRTTQANRGQTQSRRLTSKIGDVGSGVSQLWNKATATEASTNKSQRRKRQKQVRRKLETTAKDPSSTRLSTDNKEFKDQGDDDKQAESVGNAENAFDVFTFLKVKEIEACEVAMKEAEKQKDETLENIIQQIAEMRQQYRPIVFDLTKANLDKLKFSIHKVLLMVRHCRSCLGREEAAMDVMERLQNGLQSSTTCEISK